MSEILPTSIPLQRLNTPLVKLIRKLLLTQTGKRLAFAIGLRGFNRQVAQIYKYRGIYSGQALKKDEFLISHEQNPDVIPEGEQWIYAKPTWFSRVFNSRVDKGAAQQASLMAGSSLGGITSPLPPLYIALSTSSLTAAKGDTTLSGETVVAGIARALGAAQNYVAPASLDGAASYDVFKQFTLTGAGTTVVSSALFDAASTGNMFAEANFGSSAVMATNDILQVTWTINI